MTTCSLARPLYDWYIQEFAMFKASVITKDNYRNVKTSDIAFVTKDILIIDSKIKNILTSLVYLYRVCSTRCFIILLATPCRYLY